MPLGAFRHRDFRLFWGGQLVSLIGTWMQSVGQSWLVLELTGSPFSLGLVNALQFTPILLLSPVGGTLSDRLGKRQILLVTQAVKSPGDTAWTWKSGAGISPGLASARAGKGVW